LQSLIALELRLIVWNSDVVIVELDPAIHDEAQRVKQ
jgi:hypothetical protein